MEENIKHNSTQIFCTNLWSLNNVRTFPKDFSGRYHGYQTLWLQINGYICEHTNLSGYQTKHFLHLLYKINSKMLKSLIICCNF